MTKNSHNDNAETLSGKSLLVLILILLATVVVVFSGQLKSNSHHKAAYIVAMGVIPDGVPPSLLRAANDAPSTINQGDVDQAALYAMEACNKLGVDGKDTSLDIACSLANDLAKEL